MEWTIFAFFYDNLIPPVNGAVNGMVSVLATWISPMLWRGLMIYVPGRLIWMSLRAEGNPIGEMEVMIVAGSIAIMIASDLAWYGPLVRDMLMTTLDQQIGQALSGATGAEPITAAAFDGAWNRAWLAGLSVYQRLPWSVAGLGLLVVVLLFWFVAAVGTFIAFVVWIKATMMISLLVGLGPIFVGLWLFPLTRGWFYGWLNTVMSSVVLKVLIVALLSLVVGMLTRVLAQITASVAAGGGVTNEIGQLRMLISGALLFGLAAWVAYQLPGVASSITHGFAGFGHIPKAPHRQDGPRETSGDRNPGGANANTPNAGSANGATPAGASGPSTAAQSSSFAHTFWMSPVPRPAPPGAAIP